MSNLSQPIDLKNRIHSLDLLRGFALLGILIMNITSFSQIGIAYLNPTLGAGLEGYNQYFHAFNYIFADTRFMSIFSMLFGAGVVLFTERAEAKGKNPGKLHFKRMFWLLIFGLLHAYFIWQGDILVAYALCGCFVFFFRKSSVRTLSIVGTIFFIIPIALNFMTYYGMPPNELEKTFAFYSPSAEQINAQTQAMLGSYFEQMPVRIEAAIEIQTILFLIETFWRATSMMLLGMVLYKTGVLSADKSEGFYKKMITGGLTLGLIISIIGLNSAYTSNWNGAYMMNIGGSYKYTASLFVAVGYVGIVMLAFKKDWLKNLQLRLRAAGRMAFTNYIGMSVLGTFIFNGHGLGFFGSFDRLEQFLCVLVIWGIILIISPIILKKYRFGPLEWAWRKLTYWGEK